MNFYDPDLKRNLTEFEVQQEYLYMKSLNWWTRGFAKFVQTYFLNPNFTVISEAQLEHIKFKEKLKMSRLPVTFVFNNAIYSESNNHRYFKRESGKPLKVISTHQFNQAREQFMTQCANELNKPKLPKNPKPKHPKSVKYDSNDLSLTEKQVDFLKALNTVISQCNSKGDISVSEFMEKTNSRFHNNPMAVGAMLTTLQHKNVLATWKEESTNIRVVRIEKLGLDAIKKIEGDEPCK